MIVFNKYVEYACIHLLHTYIHTYICQNVNFIKLKEKIKWQSARFLGRANTTDESKQVGYPCFGSINLSPDAVILNQSEP